MFFVGTVALQPYYLLYLCISKSLGFTHYNNVFPPSHKKKSTKIYPLSKLLLRDKKLKMLATIFKDNSI
jgi:hypothetical protein